MKKLICKYFGHKKFEQVFSIPENQIHYLCPRCDIIIEDIVKYERLQKLKKLMKK